jgi:hypothetical protein
MPATTDHWVNDMTGDPLFVVTAQANAGLVTLFPGLLREVRNLIGPRRLTFVFDRVSTVRGAAPSTPAASRPLMPCATNDTPWRRWSYRDSSERRISSCNARIIVSASPISSCFMAAVNHTRRRCAIT